MRAPNPPQRPLWRDVKRWRAPYVWAGVCTVELAVFALAAQHFLR